MKIATFGVLLLPILTSEAFSSNAGGNPAFTLSNRFKAVCPADSSTIAQFDPNLLKSESNDSECTWVAIFRSNNNLPSVLIKDDFLNAMRIATSVETDGSSPSTAVNDTSISGQIENVNEGAEGVKARAPVAIGRISPSKDFEGQYTIDTLRCSLKKEDTNKACDGESEHAEAISICMDELILYHLEEGRDFDGVIRTKATIHQGRLLEDRGFEEVQELSRDMATHISSLESSVIKYAERAVETVSKSPCARDRALKILNKLGHQNPQSDEKKSAGQSKGEDSDYDPWAGINLSGL